MRCGCSSASAVVEPGHDGRRAERLVPAIPHGFPQHRSIPPLDRVDEEQRPLQVEDGVRRVDTLGQHLARLRRGHVHSPGSRPPPRTSAGQGIDRAMTRPSVGDAAQCQAAEKRGRHVVGVDDRAVWPPSSRSSRSRASREPLVQPQARNRRGGAAAEAAPHRNLASDFERQRRKRRPVRARPSTETRARCSCRRSAACRTNRTTGRWWPSRHRADTDAQVHLQRDRERIEPWRRDLRSTPAPPGPQPPIWRARLPRR